MALSTNEKKNKSRIYSRPIISLLIGLPFFTLILFVAFNEVGKSSNLGKGPKSKNQTNNELVADKTVLDNKSRRNITAIILDINNADKTIRLYDIDKNEEINLTYTSGSNIVDKYGQAISMSQVQMGQIIDGTYEGHNNKLIYLQPSKKAWEYVGVKNMTIDFDRHIIKIAKTKYTYNDPVILSEDKLINMEDIASQDVLTVRGVDETIWSIIVTKGHGYVRLEDYEAFLGGSVTVGYESVQDITKDMIITVREGNYNLTVENGEYSGTKNVTVVRNMETVVSVGDLGPEPIKYGETTFEIIPFGADLFIDGELTSYANPVKLPYGDHSIEATLGGYLTYKGNLYVDYASKNMQINLPEILSRDMVTIVETVEEYSQDDEGLKYNDWDSQQYNEEDIDTVIDEEDMEYIDDLDNIDDNPIIDTEHRIYIQNPSGASVYLNGEYKGTSPGSFQKVIGSHVLTFIKKGYQTKSYTIDIADDGLDTYISLPDLLQQ
ncbi:MAG: PEGA domain-containing protein [Clostridiales bacterium]|nr:PEGA domain-containing protein [Clostridiales bacterium]